VTRKLVTGRVCHFRNLRSREKLSSGEGVSSVLETRWNPGAMVDSGTERTLISKRLAKDLVCAFSFCLCPKHQVNFPSPSSAHSQVSWTKSAGMNRHIEGNARALRKRRSDSSPEIRWTKSSRATGKLEAKPRRPFPDGRRVAARARWSTNLAGDACYKCSPYPSARPVATTGAPANNT
jgi:hypothetical protein